VERLEDEADPIASEGCELTLRSTFQADPAELDPARVDAVDWKTKPMVRLRRPASSVALSSRTSRPAMRRVPLVGRSRPPSRCMSVDLPEPEGPSTAA